MRLGVTTGKYLLFLFTFISFCMGVALLIIGIVAKSNQLPYESAVTAEAQFSSVPVLTIIVGIFVTLISFFGCYGAITQNRCFLLTFATLVSIIFIFEFAIGIAAYTFRGKLSDVIVDGLNDTIQEYGKQWHPISNSTQNSPVVDDWDHMQEKIECCGIHNYTDWSRVNWTMASNVTRPFDIPPSCCKDMTDENCIKNTFASIEKNLTLIHNQGCWTKLNDNFRGYASTIGAAGIIFGLFQLLGIVLSCCLVSSLRDHQHF